MRWTKRIVVFAMMLSVTGVSGYSAAAVDPTTTNTAVPQSVGEPPLPQARSPIETFRELLEMTPSQQQRFLAQRPPQNQERLRAKIREYQELTPNQRELRLRETEMHYYLLPLMRSPSTNRAPHLALIPAGTRELVESRLAAWDQLAPAVQRELLENEATIRYFTEMAVTTPDRQKQALESIPASQRAALDAGIVRWRAMPEHQREQVFARFEQFFELNRREQENALSTLSDSERRNIEQTLRTFNSLNPAQRTECVRSLQKFAELSPGERQQFLQNAERWRTMRPDQRQAWRDLVNRLNSVPPLPPNASPGPPSLPLTKQKTLVTNSN